MSKVKGMWVLLWEGPNDYIVADTKVYDTKNKAIMASIRESPYRVVIGASSTIVSTPFKLNGVYRLESED